MSYEGCGRMDEPSVESALTADGFQIEALSRLKSHQRTREGD